MNCVVRLADIEQLSLLALRPLVEVTDCVHNLSRTDAEHLPMATKLIDAACLLSQSVYKLNALRVSIGFI